MNMEQRIVPLDIAKGISIILVALYHSDIGACAPGAMDSMCLFRMPLFFFVSGIFFHSSGDFAEIARKKTEALLKPYAVTLAVVMLFDVVVGEGGTAWKLLAVLYGNGVPKQWIPLWFLTHLWLVFMATRVLLKATRMRDRPRLVQVVCLALPILLWAGRLDMFWKREYEVLGRSFLAPGLPFSADILPITLPFFLMGRLLRDRAMTFRPSLWAVLGCIAVYAAVVAGTDAHVGINRRIYTEPLPATLGALCGVYCVMSASYYLQKVRIAREVLLAAGRASLFILLFHLFVHTQTLRLMETISGREPGAALMTAAFATSIAVPVMMKNMVARSPFLSLLYLPRGKGRSSFVRTFPQLTTKKKTPVV